MPRLLILATLLGLAFVVLLVTTDVFDLGGSLEADPDAPLEFERDAWAPEGEENEPVLSAATAKRAEEAAKAAKRKREPDPTGPTGPYAFDVIDSETLAPLDKVEFRDEDDVVMGVTDEKGRWDTADAGTSRLRFRAVKTGYVIHTGIAEPDRPLEVVLHAGVSIKGIVVVGAGAKPLSGASVRVWDLDFGREIVATSTGEDGSFRMHAVRPHHPVSIVIAHPERAPYIQRALFDTVAPEEYVVTVPEGGRLAGKVTDSKGMPVKGAAVWLMPDGRRPLAERDTAEHDSGRRRIGPRDIMRARTATTRTDEQGRYAFVGVETMRNWIPAVFPTARHLVRGTAVRFAADGEEQTLDLQYPSSATLHVGLRGPLGEVLSNADLEIHTREGRVDVLPTDHWEGGVLVVEGLTPGPATVIARIQGRPPRSKRVKLREGATERVDLKFDAGGDVLGVVTDERGEPIWKARVTWISREPREFVDARTDQHGRFHFKGLIASSGTLRVSGRDLPHTQKTYESFKQEGTSPGEGKQFITLKDGTSIQGSFPDLEPGTEVTCQMISGRENTTWTLRLDKRSAFVRDGPDPYSFAPLFIFKTRGRPPLIVREINAFSSGETRDLGSLLFESTNPRRGRVLGPDRRPIHGAKISVVENWSTRSTRTDAKGDFVLARLPDRNVSIRITADGYPEARYTLRADAQFRRAVYQLRRGTQVLVFVRDKQGRSGAGFQVVVRPNPKTWRSNDPIPDEKVVVADRKGLATFWLPDGAYEFGAFSEANPRVHAMRSFTVKPKKKNKPVRVNLMLNGSLR